MEKFIADIPSREEMLLRKIQAQLKSYRPPQRAEEYQITVPTEELAVIMAWAEIALHNHVMRLKEAVHAARYAPPPPILITQGKEEPNA